MLVNNHLLTYKGRKSYSGPTTQLRTTNIVCYWVNNCDRLLFSSKFKHKYVIKFVCRSFFCRALGRIDHSSRSKLHEISQSLDACHTNCDCGHFECFGAKLKTQSVKNQSSKTQRLWTIINSSLLTYMYIARPTYKHTHKLTGTVRQLHRKLYLTRSHTQFHAAGDATILFIYYYYKFFGETF